MRRKRREDDEIVSSSDPDAQYSLWSSPLVALRDALGSDSQRVEDNRTTWTAWLRERGLDTTWLPRLSVDDRRVGKLVVVEDSYEFRVPPRVIYDGEVAGPGPDAPLVLPCEGARYWTTRHATIVGGWDVFGTPDGACWPALTPRVESILVSNALESRLLGWTPSFMIVRDDGSVSHRQTHRSFFRRRDGHRLDQAIALVGEHSFQYGHWLSDYLPRTLAVRGLSVDIPVLVDADVPPNSLWWLSKVLPDRPIVLLELGQAVDVRRLFVPLQRTFCPTGWIDSMEMTPDMFSLDPSAVTQVQRLVIPDTAAPTRHRRLWLGRRGGHRPLLNQEELFACAAPDGFEMVYLEDLSMRETQHLLDETKDIIAPAGSQLNNLPAARPGLRVLSLIGDGTARTRAMEGNPHFIQASGHDIALVVGRSVGQRVQNPYDNFQLPFTIDRDLLETARCEFFGASGGASGSPVTSARERHQPGGVVRPLED